MRGRGGLLGCQHYYTEVKTGEVLDPSSHPWISGHVGG